MIAATQLVLLPEQTCHFKNCIEPAVSASITGKGHVCNRHNNLEWARALARNKHAGYWHIFGKRWLAELEGTRA